MNRQLFEAMDRDPPHDSVISMDEFIYYYSAYEDYLRDAFAGYCTSIDATADFDMNVAEWYYQDADGETVGPCTLVNLKELYDAGSIQNDSNVWCEEIDSWQPAGVIEQLFAYLTN
jgi:hypothetical protein